MLFRSVILVGLAVAVCGCAPPAASTGGFNSDDPASKLYAIRAAGEARDRAAIPDLVEQLESDDPAVRLFAIHALEQITGERLGYNPFADDPSRNAGVERWIEAVKKKRFAQGP